MRPTEHKPVQVRILKYAQETGWTFVPRAEAERRRSFKAAGDGGADRAVQAALYFEDLLLAKLREFNPKYGEGALTGRLRQLPANIFGNREFLGFVWNSKSSPRGR